MEIPAGSVRIQWMTSILWLERDGVLYSKPIPGNEHAVFTREEAIREMKRLRSTLSMAEGDKICMVALTGANIKTSTKEDREFIVGQLNDFLKALALISPSPLSRMVAKVFFTLKKPVYPVRVFSNEAEARKWIKKYA